MKPKRFKPKKQKELIKALSELFSIEEHHISENEALKIENCTIIDSANVCGIEAKTEEAKRILNKFIDEDNKRDVKKLPDLDYNDDSSKGCAYSSEYLALIMNIFNISNDRKSFRIKIKEDYPATLEDENFKVLLAPRVWED